MKYVIIGWDGKDGLIKRPEHRAAHLKRLTELQSHGKLICAGPFTDKTGSLIIIEADSLAEAESFASKDPYLLHGVFERIEIHPFNQVLPVEKQERGF